MSKDKRQSILIVTVLLALISLVLDNLHNIMGTGDYSPCAGLDGLERLKCTNAIYDITDWWHDLGRYSNRFMWSGYLALFPITMREITAVLWVVWLDSAKELLDLLTNNNVGNPTRDNVIYVGLILAVVLVHANAVKWVKERIRGRD